MIRCESASVDQTRAVAAALAGLVHDGDLIVLVGDLGAGKTAFTQGFAVALGVDVPVTSPTFTLANRYEGRIVVNHLDAYRVDDPNDAADLAIPELLEDGVTLIEWGNNIRPVLPGDLLEIRITLGDGDDDRSLEFVGAGPSWTARHRAMTEALEPLGGVVC